MSENIDEITLGSQTLRVRGPVAGKVISEFTAGLKVGLATYDERLHAFWVSMADFSGGVGHRYEDLREETGILWDNQGGVDVRRAGCATLPPLQTTIDVVEPAGYNYTYRWPSAPVCLYTASGAIYFGFGSGIYYLSGTYGDSQTLVKNISAGGALYADMISSILEFNGGLYAFPEYHTTPLTCPYLRATADPTVAGNWTAPGITTTAIFDAIVFDQKLLGTCNDATGLKPIIVYSVNGANWNIDDAADAAAIWTGTSGRIRFVGNLISPWGEPAVYFLAPGRSGISLYCLDFFARKAHEILISPGVSVQDAVIWNGQVIVSDGMSVYSYSPNGEIVREMGLPRKNGAIPPSFILAWFNRLFTIGPYLYCTVNQPDAVGGTVAATQVWCWNGAGWTPFGEQVSGTGFSVHVAAGVSVFNGVTLTVQRSIVLFGNRGPATNTDGRRVTMQLPWYADVPTYGYDQFATGPVSFITPWFTGGFDDLDGVLYWLKCSGINITSNHPIKVEYALDYDETTWTQMRNTSAAAATFTSHTTVLYFKTTTPVKVGVQFRAIRFRVTLSRDAGDTHHTPELRALTLCYDKKPLARTAWTFNLDVNGMLERAAQYTIGGNPFTVARLWALLKTLWNTEILLVLDVPSISIGMYVKMEALSGTFEDFRAAVAARGVVTITCLEPIDA